MVHVGQTLSLWRQQIFQQIWAKQEGFAVLITHGSSIKTWWISSMCGWVVDNMPPLKVPTFTHQDIDKWKHSYVVLYCYDLYKLHYILIDRCSIAYIVYDIAPLSFVWSFPAWGLAWRCILRGRGERGQHVRPVVGFVRSSVEQVLVQLFEAWKIRRDLLIDAGCNRQ